ncbi:unnamed protein product [Durusdinium trenchii]|uniref:FACT complex subunit n=2 Tax=Durusdinium trenchii TaxID=1381693 RepID=A0ABP0HIF2_9DINO
MRDWKYFGSLATCSNVCRDVGKAIYSEWVKDYGIASAKQHCKSLWPKAIAGRWSGCNKSEERFLLCGRQRLAPILTTVLGKTAASAKKSVKSTVDEHSVEEAQAYSERMSRWKKRTAECIQDSLWWQVVEVMNKTRGPLSHFSNFLHKPQGEWGHIAQLVGGKANDIKEEFNSVWSSLRKSGCLAHTGNENDYDSDQVQSQFVRNLAMDVLLHSASGYHRKVMLQLNAGEFRLLLLAEAPPRKFCLRRQQEAKHILEETSKSSKKQTCSTSLLKFRTLFEKDLAWAASAGYCSYRMYITLRGLACMIEPDVQPSERLNKALTLFGDRCPSGTLDLRTGRAAMKHFLGAYSISSTKRYKDMKPAAKALMAECLKGWALLDEVDSNENRFQHAEKRNDLPSLEQAKKNDSTLEPIASTAYPLLTLKPLDKTSAEAIMEFADEDEEEDCDAHSTGNDLDTQETDEVGEILSRMKAAASAPSGVKCDDDEGDDGDDGDGDDPWQMLREMAEQYEANHVAGDSGDVSEANLIRQAAGECYDDAVAHDCDIDNSFEIEQKMEMMQEQQTRVESAIAQSVLASGIKVQGAALLKIAENAVAVP